MKIFDEFSIENNLQKIPKPPPHMFGGSLKYDIHIHLHKSVPFD